MKFLNFIREEDYRHIKTINADYIIKINESYEIANTKLILQMQAGTEEFLIAGEKEENKGNFLNHVVGCLMSGSNVSHIIVPEKDNSVQTI